MKLPIPLGGIAIKRSIDKTIAEKINGLIRKSIEYSFRNHPLISDYVKENSQEMSEEVMRKHIDLYVNDYSLDLGKEGKHAIEVLFSIYYLMNGDEKSIPSSSNLFPS
jgi:1,4-dihydroxy-6-naphthoate synthase